MSETTETRVETNGTATATKAPRPKAKKAAPAPKAMAAKKATAAKAPAAAAKTPGGVKPNQLKVLECLARTSKALTRKEIAEKTGVDQASLTGYIGPVDDDKRRYNDEHYFTTLVTLGYVRHELDREETGVIRHVITPRGKAYLEKSKK